jgi:hypothetical protein
MNEKQIDIAMYVQIDIAIRADELGICFRGLYKLSDKKRKSKQKIIFQ